MFAFPRLGVHQGLPLSLSHFCGLHVERFADRDLVLVFIDQVAALSHGRKTRYPSLVLGNEGGLGTRGSSKTLSYNQFGRPVPASSDAGARAGAGTGSGVEDVSGGKGAVCAADVVSSVDADAVASTSLEDALSSAANCDCVLISFLSNTERT